MNKYSIIAHIQIIGTNFWIKDLEIFHKEDLKAVDLKINYISHLDFKYNLATLPSQSSPPVLKSGDYLLCVNADWSEVTITLMGKENISDLSRLLNALLMSHLSTRGVLLLHASLVDVAGRGIMFLGPSGIGKTTQAELWMKYRRADIINGDMVYVKREPERFLGCGSPWHGSSSYCLNRQVPLAGLVVLKQSQENSIRRLTDMEMITAVMNSVFFPSWYREGYEAACDTLDALLEMVPVYELSCRPDEDAVRLTEETVFREEL